MGKLVDLLKIEDVIRNPALAQGLTKDCSGCDPYTPYHQQRESCTVCGGTGQEPLAIAVIAQEIAEAKAEGSNGNGKKKKRSSLID